MNIDELSPAYIGEDRIALTVNESSELQAFKIVQIDIDYSGCDPQGVERPLDLIIQGPTEEGYIERVFRRYTPSSITFIPIQAGDHLIVLREQAHNRWFGQLVVTIAGDPFEKV